MQNTGRFMTASAAHLVTRQLEVRYVGEEASDHLSNAFATTPWLTSIDDDASVLRIEGRYGIG